MKQSKAGNERVAGTESERHLREGDFGEKNFMNKRRKQEKR